MEESDSLKNSLFLLLKIFVVCVFAFFAQIRFYYHLLSREILTGDYYAPCGFFFKSKQGKVIRDARLISVIEPEYHIKMTECEDMKFIDVGVYCLVTRRNKFQRLED